MKANREQGKIDYKLLFLEQGPMVETVVALGYEAEVMEAGRIREVMKYTALIFKIRRWIKNHKIEAVMSWMSKAHLYGGPAAWLAGVPSVWWQHGMSGEGGLQRIIHALPAKAVICCSQSVARLQHQALPNKLTRVIYPAIDNDLMGSIRDVPMQEARRQLGLPVDKKIVGLAARLQHWKGVHIFVQAAERIHTLHPDVQFVVIGGEHFSEPDYLAQLQQQTELAGLGDRLRFAGHQDNPALWMQAFDIVVHASTSFEPFGMVVIEGMALGKGVVATRSGGPEEIIEDGVNGLLVQPNDAESLANGILYFTENIEETQVMGGLAQHRAQQFNDARLGLEMADLLQNLVAGLESHPVPT